MLKWLAKRLLPLLWPLIRDELEKWLEGWLSEKYDVVPTSEVM